jgi:hypothetical protein
VKTPPEDNLLKRALRMWLTNDPGNVWGNGMAELIQETRIAVSQLDPDWDEDVLMTIRFLMRNIERHDETYIRLTCAKVKMIVKECLGEERPVPPVSNVYLK